jgi:hypothetical protein
MSIEASSPISETIAETIPGERNITLENLRQAESFNEFLETLGAFDENIGGSQIDVDLGHDKTDILYKDEIKKFAHDLWHAINESDSQAGLVQKMGQIIPMSFANIIDINAFSRYAQDVFETDGENFERLIKKADSIVNIEKIFSLRKGIKNTQSHILSGRAVLSTIEDLKLAKGKEFDGKLQELPETCGLRAKVKALFELNA